MPLYMTLSLMVIVPNPDDLSMEYSKIDPLRLTEKEICVSEIVAGNEALLPICALCSCWSNKISNARFSCPGPVACHRQLRAASAEMTGCANRTPAPAARAHVRGKHAATPLANAEGRFFSECDVARATTAIPSLIILARLRP
jgi:hypothetical protein